MKQNFSPGDIVVRKNGGTPMVVVRVSETGAIVIACYCGATFAIYKQSHDKSLPEALKADKIELVTDPIRQFARCTGWADRLTLQQAERLRDQVLAANTPPITEEGNTMTKLYQTKEDTPRFGTLLATNSAGKFVLEMKGSGEVLAFDKKDVEEVKPYTVRVTVIGPPTGGMGTRDRDYDYISQKGAVEKGDLILLSGPTGNLARVTAVDTKSSKATFELRGRKLLTLPIGADMDDDLPVTTEEL